MKLEHLTDGAPRQRNEVGFRKAFISRVLRKGYVAVSGKKKKVVKCTFLCVLASHLRCNLTQMIQPLCALSFPVERKKMRIRSRRDLVPHVTVCIKEFHKVHLFIPQLLFGCLLHARKGLGIRNTTMNRTLSCTHRAYILAAKQR